TAIILYHYAPPPPAQQTPQAGQNTAPLAPATPDHKDQELARLRAENEQLRERIHLQTSSPVAKPVAPVASPPKTNELSPAALLKEVNQFAPVLVQRIRADGK